MRVILESKSGHRLQHEETVVAEWLLLCGQTYNKASLSQIQRQRVDAKEADLVVGTLPFIKAALQQSKISMPVDDTYPDVLVDLLHRKVIKLPLYKVLDEIEQGGVCFVKPADRAKLFTGYVLRPGDDYQIKHVPRREMVWRSDVVKWVSEWRFYVVCGQIQAQACYSGDASTVPDQGVVEEAVARLASIETYPKHHAIDFGVLDNGCTALVECNEGFSIGAYEGVPASVYFEMLKGRWRELLTQAKEKDHGRTD